MSNPTPHNSPKHIAILFTGYAIGLFACATVFTAGSFIAFPISIICIAITSGKVAEFPSSKAISKITLYGGLAVIFAILSYFGDERIRTWRPHPAGYIPAWFLLHTAARHIISLGRHPQIAS